MTIQNLNKSEVLAALYNNAKPLGMGFLEYDPREMKATEAQQILDSGQDYFDYLKGRLMKVDLSNEEVDTWLYNRDNGAGAAEGAIAPLLEKQAA